MDVRSELSSQVKTSFKLHGFQLRAEACKHFVDLLQPLNNSEWDEWIDKVLENLQRSGLESPVVDKAVLVKTIQECSNEVADDAGDLTHVISAFDVPRLTYTKERKKYVTDASLGLPGPKLYADALSKPMIFQTRYDMLHQRTSRHDLFSPAAFGSKKDEKKFQLKKIEYLLGTTNKLTGVIVLGMLTQSVPGKYTLEDPTGVVTLDMSEAKFHKGLFTETCFVLVEGWYEDLVFHALAVGFPPTEPAKTTRAYFGDINFFGGPSEHSAKSSVKLLKVEEEKNDSMLVFLSDVWLDKAEVMTRLGRLFAGYSKMPPTAIVLMGNFLSSPQGSHHAGILRDHFRELGELIAQHKKLVENTKFLFVPGNTDPGAPNLFPRPALSGYVTEELRKRVKNAEFASNPCRLQYCTQEIVIFREDIVTKMCRNCIYFPESGEIPAHFAKTIISQGHLTPLPMEICPVYWDYDRSMFLYPLPDLIVIGDKFDPFVTENSECKIMNPGSFAKNEFSFKTYIPSTKIIEESQVPMEDDES